MVENVTIHLFREPETDIEYLYSEYQYHAVLWNRYGELMEKQLSEYYFKAYLGALGQV